MFHLGAAGDSSYVARDRQLVHQIVDNDTTASHSGVSCCRNNNEN